jgi:trehalose 6-phosphate synthase/phosphatase
MKETESKRLILVSNRLPFQLQEKDGKVSLKQSDGGLVTALKSYFDQDTNEDTFDEKIWIGSADFPHSRWEKFISQDGDGSQFAVEPIFIDPKIYNKFYNGFCNATLWPLFHYFPSFVVYEKEYFEMYEEANQLFADKLLQIIQPGDTIWVHDYQLFLLPGMIREKEPSATIGFFLHIPFPSYEIFRLLHRPWKEKIIRGMLGADLIGFHTHEYVQHFLKTVRMVVGADHQYRLIGFEDRLVKCELFPLGVDYKLFSGTSSSPAVIEKAEAIKNNFAGRKIIFSVDRLDYTKGVTHRLDGYERFLTTYPDWKEKVVFVLVVVPSRQIISKYNERRKLIEEQVGSINGKYSTLSWQPLIYRYNHLAFDELCALYHAADVGLITPLRDGMNLVAKEYVACCSDQKGVLILSELAGAASELGEAILVNPLDQNEVAEAIEQALTLGEEEQEKRLTVMQQRLLTYDVTSWVNDFLTQLRETKQQQKEESNKYLTREKRNEIITRFRDAEEPCLLLDYDGTLVGFAKHPKDAVPDKNLLKLLQDLTSLSGNTVAIISGRDAATMEEWFGKLPLALVAEHGASIKRKDDTWEIRDEIDQSWKRLIRPTFEMFVKRCPGSFIEEKNHTLAWHYRKVEAELGFTRSREVLDNLYHLVRNGLLQILDGNKVIEVRVAGIDKGVAVKKLMEDNSFDFILAVGDDKTDEDMFRAVNDRGITIKVGAGHSGAQYFMQNQRDVIKLLRELVEERQIVKSNGRGFFRVTE